MPIPTLAQEGTILMSPAPDSPLSDDGWIKALRTATPGTPQWDELGHGFLQDFHAPVRALTKWKVRKIWQDRVPPEILEEGIQLGLGNFFILGIHSFGGRSSLLTFLTNICKNATLDILRREATQEGLRRKREKEPELGIGTEIVMDEEMADLLDEFCSNLSDLDARILKLRHRDEEKLKDISLATGHPIPTVHSHLKRTEKQLKDWLLKRLHGPDASVSNSAPRV